VPASDLALALVPSVTYTGKGDGTMSTRLLLGLCLALSTVACSDGDKSDPGKGDGGPTGGDGGPAGGDGGPAADAAKDAARADAPVAVDTKGADTAGGDAAPAEDGGGASDGGATAEPVECTGDKPCAAGVCEGASCDGTWTCSSDGRACTTDLVEFCGCDGTTFKDSSSCPRRPVAFRGKCEDGVSCDVRKVTCSTAAPSCIEGNVPRVVGSCYDGTCVPLGHCTCTDVADCPAGKLMCIEQRCQAPLMGAAR
jgi:hypothetical protein